MRDIRPTIAEIDDQIGTAMDNIRELIEQAAAAPRRRGRSGGATHRRSGGASRTSDQETRRALSKNTGEVR
jgi:hypothetical protein